jgi:hypothetical protein
MIDPKTVRNREASFRPIDDKYQGDREVTPLCVKWYILIRRAEHFRKRTGNELRGVYISIHLGDYMRARRELQREVARHNEVHDDWPVLENVRW